MFIFSFIIILVGIAMFIKSFLMFNESKKPTNAYKFTHKYKYIYDISNVSYVNCKSKDGITTQMRHDIYGLYGNKHRSLPQKLFLEANELKDNITEKEILSADLSKLHPEICWMLYNRLREMKRET